MKPDTRSLIQQAIEASNTTNFVRSFVVDSASINVEARTVAMSYASEVPVERWFGMEVLDCNPSSVRQGRLRSGANLLMDHNTRDVVGVVETSSVDSDKVCRVVVRFGKSERAEEVFQDVIDGIRKNVSVGYQVHKYEVTEVQGGIDIVRMTDWEPLEVSLVSVPADASVGVGRSLNNQSQTFTKEGARTMGQEQTPVAAASAVATAPAIAVEPKIDHARTITGIAGTNPVLRDMAFQYIQEGKTADEFQRAAIEKLSTMPVKSAEIGLTDKESKRFSIHNLINAQANPGDSAARARATFEYECSDAVSKVTGRQANGVFVPYDVLSKRDLTAGNEASAGTLITTELRGDSFIELLRKRMVMAGLGVRFIDGLVGDVDFPRLIGAGSAYWVGEQEAPNKSQTSYDRVKLSAKTVGARTIISRKLRQQTSFGVENMTLDDLNKVLMLEMQRVMINGSGQDNEPLGLLNIPGIAQMAATGPIDWKRIVALETAVSTLDADVGDLAYLTNALVRGALKTTQKAEGTNGQMIWAEGNTPVNGYNCAITNAVPSNFGTTNDLSALIYGNFNDIYVGLWGGVDLLVDPYTGGAQGDLQLRVLQDMDMAVRHKESFAMDKNIATS